MYQVAEVLELSFSISPSNEYSGWIPFRMDWFDLLAVQGTLKSLLQHHSSKALILQCSAFFFILQLSHPYMTTGKTIALTRRTFVSKVMSLLFNKLFAAAAKSLQSCPTLCDPTDAAATRIPCPWDFPGKNTGVGCHFLLHHGIILLKETKNYKTLMKETKDDINR